MKSHLNSMLSCFAHRQEVRDDVSNQVSAHLYGCVEVILKQTAWQLHCFNLRIEKISAFILQLVMLQTQNVMHFLCNLSNLVIHF